MRYLKKFETSTAFESFILDENNTPNVSLIEELLNTPGGIVFTKKILPQLDHDYSLDYLTFVAIDDCCFNFSVNIYDEGDGLSYSLDNGETWTEYLQQPESTIYVSSGNKILFKGHDIYFGGSCGTDPTFINEYYYYDENENYIEINSQQRFNIEGNIMSLIYGDDFNGQTTLTNDDIRFSALFSRLSSLISAENLILPTNTTTNCYSCMFDGCTSLTIPPILRATTLAQYCYNDMFYGCASLNSIICLATSMLEENCTYGWLGSVAQIGTFKLATTSIWEIGESGIPNGWDVEYYDISQISGYAANYFTLVAIDDCDFEFDCCYNGYLSYSLDNGVTWSESYKSRKENNKINVTAGNKILFKGNNNTNFVEYSGSYPLFHSNARYNVEGNIMSLIYGDDFVRHLSLNEEYIFASLFTYETNLISAANLVLPAIILATGCYMSMFNGCTSLTTGPVLRAPYLTEDCYSLMFYGCSSLNSITCLATNISEEDCTNKWLYGVAQTGTFTKASDMTDWETGDDGIPSGWTVQNA